jgi:Uma2 family endonuclease
MSTRLANHRSESHAGLRLSQGEYFALPRDEHRYELVDGVVTLSPSPSPNHQYVAKVIFRQLDDYVEMHQLGVVLYEVDVALPQRAGRGDAVYRPEIIVVLRPDADSIVDRIECVPALVVEVVSPDSRNLDAVTKFEEYERAGVAEYWLADPEQQTFRVFRRSGGGFVEAPVAGEAYESQAVPGLRLDVASIRAAYRQFRA